MLVGNLSAPEGNQNSSFYQGPLFSIFRSYFLVPITYNYEKTGLHLKVSSQNSGYVPFLMGQQFL